VTFKPAGAHVSILGVNARGERAPGRKRIGFGYPEVARMGSVPAQAVTGEVPDISMVPGAFERCEDMPQYRTTIRRHEEQGTDTLF
jgi:hypothetical protein